MSTATFVQGDGHMQKSYRMVGDKTEQLYDKSQTKITTASQLLAITEPTYAALNVTDWSSASKIGTPATWNSNCNTLAIPTSYGNSYTVKYFGIITTARTYCGELDSNGNILCIRYTWTDGGTVTPTMSDCAYLCIEWSLDTTDNSQIVIVEGTTAPSSYIPFGYEIPLPHASNCGMVDLGTLTWGYNGTRFRASLSGLKYQTVLSLSPNMYCNGLTVMSQNSYDTSDNCITTSDSSEFLLAKCSAYTDAASFKSAMSGVYLFYQRTTDDDWTAPTINKMYVPKPLGKIGDVVDKASLLGGGKYNEGEITLNSDTVTTSDIYIASSYIGVHKNCFPNVLMPNNSVQATHWENGSYTSTEGAYCSMSGTTYFAWNKASTPDLTTAQEVLDWLDEEQPTIYYPLATEEEEDIDAPAITFAEGINYLDCNATVAPSEGKVQYYGPEV